MWGRQKPSKETVAIVAAMCIVVTLVIAAPGIAIVISIIAAFILGGILAVSWPRKRNDKTGRHQKSKAREPGKDEHEE